MHNEELYSQLPSWPYKGLKPAGIIISGRGMKTLKCTQ